MLGTASSSSMVCTSTYGWLRPVSVCGRWADLRTPRGPSSGPSSSSGQQHQMRNFSQGLRPHARRLRALPQGTVPDPHWVTERYETLSLSRGLDPLALLQQQQLYSTAEGLETPIQLLYLLALLGFLSVGAFLVVRQVLIRRELDEAAKALGERIRTGEATCEDYFELGVILTRKKLFTQATKNLEKAKKVWDGEETELAQVHNALGFCFINMDRVDLAAAEYKKAVALQPGYVTAWNNLGDACEKNKQWREALNAYLEALSYAPSNQVAQQRSEFCRQKLERLSTTSL